MRVLSLFALAAPLVSAIQFLEPVTNSTLKKGQTYSVKWDSVDTDPTVFSIFLVNFVDWPPFYTQVASDVQTSAGEQKVTVPCDVNTSWGFQFNAINGTNVYVIHAQTSKFFVRDGVCSGAGPISPPENVSSTCEPVTVTEIATSTVTVSPTCSLLPPVSSSVTASTTTTTTTDCATSPIATETPADESSDSEDSDSESSDSDSDSDSEDSEDSTAVPTGSNSSAQPTVTSPPSMDDVKNTSTKSVITSTVYSTMYLDLSEVGDCDRSCVVG